MLSVRNLNVSVGAFRLQDINLKVSEGDYFVLLGPSGAGKSLLLETLAGFVRPASGSIALDGRDITHSPIQSRGLGLVYQSQNLFPHRSVARNIGYSLEGRKATRREIEDRVHELAEAVGVTELLDRKPGSLSGGEAQRVALARVLASNPRCLLLDEPLASLDKKARAELRAVLRRVPRDGQTLIHVTHDYEEAIALADRIAVMENGRIPQQGTPKEVLQHPTSEFVASFIGIRNFFRGELTRRPAGVQVFRNGVVEFAVLSDAPDGSGSLILRSEDVTVSANRPEGSARNVFQGTVTEVIPAHLGYEATVDIGVPLIAMVTEAAVHDLELAPGKTVWVSFKATAGRFIEA